MFNLWCRRPVFKPVQHTYQLSYKPCLLRSVSNTVFIFWVQTITLISVKTWCSKWKDTVSSIASKQRCKCNLTVFCVHLNIFLFHMCVYVQRNYDFWWSFGWNGHCEHYQLEIILTVEIRCLSIVLPFLLAGKGEGLLNKSPDNGSSAERPFTSSLVLLSKHFL